MRKAEHNTTQGPLGLIVVWFQRTLLIWLVLSSWLAYQWTTWFPGRVDPFAEVTKTQLNYSIAITMLAVGLLLPQDEIRQVFRRWPLVLIGVLIQYLSMPLLAWIVAKAAGFTGQEAIGLIVVGCVPGAMASNVLTMNARGNTSYSVSLTTVATLLSPLAVPLALWATLSGDDSVTPQTLLKSSLFMLLTVVAPVIVGYLLGRFLPGWRSTFRWIGTVVANLAILFIIAVIVGKTREHVAEFRADILISLLVLNLMGYIAGYVGGFACGLTESMRRALTLEVGMQNAGAGTVLALNVFSGQAAVAPAIYTFGCMLTGTILALVWSLFPPREAAEEEDEP